MPGTVMVVDDSKTIREMIAFTLGNAGFKVTQAEDGSKALTALASGTADLVVTDLNMPKMDGIALIRSLRANPKYRAVPILMLTTESDAEKKAQGKAAGATGWLVKPFDPDKLVELTRRFCP